jgi:hypothetical protein
MMALKTPATTPGSGEVICKNIIMRWFDWLTNGNDVRQFFGFPILFWGGGEDSAPLFDFGIIFLCVCSRKV